MKNFEGERERERGSAQANGPDLPENQVFSGEMCNHGKETESRSGKSSSTKQQQSGNNNKNNKKKKMLVKFQDLPQYMKDNEYILDYYRCEWPLKDVIFSVFAWHNETLNIWT